jgi:hypothetical protein
MLWNTNWKASGLIGVVSLSAVCLGLLGCAGQTLDAFSDSAAVSDEAMTTPSADAVRRSGKPALVGRRATCPSQCVVAAQDGTVTHWPLWWEDPLEDKGSDDGRVAWTWEDYAALFYCPARLVVNTAAFPISAMATLPGTVLCSDGRISKQLVWRDHDASVCGAGKPGPDSLVSVAARASRPPSAEPVLQQARPFPRFED